MTNITRRGFFQQASLFTAGGLALSGALPGLVTKRAHAQPIPDWLALTNEPALEPELPIIDPHHHLWDRPNNRYMLEDLLEDTSTHNVRQTVFVECTSMYRADGPEELRVVGETEFVQGVAAKSASGGYGEMRAATGIVGSANLRLGDRVAAVLEAQIAASPQRFRGIRHRAAWADRSVLPNQRADSPEHILLDPDFRKGYAHLRTYGLSFEGWLYHTHIADLTDLAKAFPDTIIIFNHLGGPIGVGNYAGRRDEVFAAWKPAVAELASCPNVVAKVGGIQMVVNGYGWHEQDRPPTSDELLAANRDWYNYTIDQFGPDRCMFESNFPVDKLSCSYTVLWNQFKKLTRGFSADERAAMFHDTAKRVYRLPLV
ncbi:MAG: amidohydrolase family protein [Gammaproteobacteria bacterium]|jgi:predicted TIM-barrel fold metal-dependent hydrolase|nr:amidohydrolase [Gammaproteobacteria bacterium]MDP6097078.1 amidohydrolase family protein [Gammaproteobacteria bacterium]HJO11206.1 amidohydrolase family protein [Gammaproteobacteria bacterium]